MKLFVDDLREAPEGWERVRTVTDAIRVLANQVIRIDEVSLDHDIFYSSVGGKAVRMDCPESFQAVAYYIVVMPEDTRPDVVYIHTANNEGARILTLILEGKVKKVIRDTTYHHEWDAYLQKKEADLLEKPEVTYGG